jgi:hypothetical protein
MIKNLSKNVMLDPSVLIARKGVDNTFDLINRLQPEYTFYISKSFRAMLLSDNQFNEQRVFRYFLHNAVPAELRDVREMVQSTALNTVPISPKALEKYSLVWEALFKPSFFETVPRVEGGFGKAGGYDQVTLQVLFEEWVFLQEYSWVVSRLKKPFNKMINSGAACLEFGKHTVEGMLKRTLKKDDDELLRKVDVLRGFGKWIAVGGPPIASLINPIVGALSGAIGGYFLLFDPQQE